MDELKAIADKHNLILIEDCAQAWGAKYRGKPVGTIGHIACFSLQQTKQITAGDGGVVGSSDERFGPLLQRFGDKGANRTQARPANVVRHELPNDRAASRLRRRAADPTWRTSPRRGRTTATCSAKKSPAYPASCRTASTQPTGPPIGSTCSASSPRS